MKYIFFLSFFFSLATYAAPYEKGQVFENPRRDVSIILTDEGYYPSSLSAFVGEDIRITLTSTSQSAGCLVLDNHKLYMAANRGKLTMDQIRFEKPGVYHFYCPNNKVISGKIIVLEKKNKAADRKREIASQFKGQWRPSDF